MRRIVLLIIIALLMIIGIISLVYYLNDEIVLTGLPMGYFIANDGNDSNDGLSPDTPWRSIGKVNSELNGGCINVGDDIYFNRGDTFTDVGLGLRKGGTSSDWMIIGAYGSGTDPIFSDMTNGIEIYESDIGYIKIQEIDINKPSNIGIRSYQNHIHNLTISNVDVNNPGGNGVIISSINYFTIEDTTVDNAGMAGICVYGNNNEAYDRASNTIARNCTVSNPTTDGFTYHSSDSGNNPIGKNHLIINCTSYNCAKEQGFDLTSGENFFIKDCEGWNNVDGTFVLGHGIKNVTIDNFYGHDESQEGAVISSTFNSRIRNSIFYNSEYRLLVHNSGLPVENITFYNNDFIFEKDTGRINWYVGDVLNAIHKNNIFYSNSSKKRGDYFIYISDDLASAHFNFSHNMWWQDGDTDSTARWHVGGFKRKFTAWQSFAETEGELRDNASIFDISNEKFNLTSDSPAIDAGAWLTTTNGGGSGNTITLHEANYFFPGLRTLGVSGDNIFVGDDINLEITKVDYANEQITVNRSITWVDGENVSLSSYIGSGPDIGAFEFKSVGMDV